MKIVFFGTSWFAADLLRTIVDRGVSIEAIVTKPDRPKGRSGTPTPPPVKEIAQVIAPDVPVFQPAKASNPEFIPNLKALNADLFVVAAYGEILNQDVLDLPKFDCINVHGSLLPKYRGAAPIQYSILNGETETGVTIMKMVLKMDAGEMIRKRSVPITSTTTSGELEATLSQVGAEELYEVLLEYQAKGYVESVPQDDSQVTFAHRIELKDCELNFDQSAEVVNRHIRAFNPHPGSWSWILIKGQKKRLKIHQAEVTEGHGDPGTFFADEEGHLSVYCHGDALRLLSIQPEGKRVMTGEEFLRGVQVAEVEALID